MSLQAGLEVLAIAGALLCVCGVIGFGSILMWSIVGPMLSPDPVETALNSVTQ